MITSGNAYFQTYSLSCKICSIFH